MKSKVCYILSTLLLLSFVGQLVISSTSCLYSDENTEETYELGSEDDVLDDEVDLDKKICSFDWFIIHTAESKPIDIFHSSSLHLLGEYTLIDRSIPVPPPEKMG